MKGLIEKKTKMQKDTVDDAYLDEAYFEFSN